MRAAVAGIALLVVLAGCPALDVDRDPGPRASPTATPTPISRPIGLSAAGVTDPWQLREAHVRVLEGRSYTYDYRLTVGWGGTQRGLVEVTYRVTGDRSRALLAREVSGEVPEGMVPASDLRRYDAGTTSYIRVATAGETDVVRSPPGATLSDDYAPDRDFVYLLLSGVDTAVSGTVTRDGRTLYVVSGTAPRAEVPRGRARNVSVRAVVAPSGLVVEFRAAYDLHRETGPIDARRRMRVVHHVRYRDVGETTVERPDWAVSEGTETPSGEQRGGGTVDDGSGFGQPPVVPEPVGPTSLRGPVGER